LLILSDKITKKMKRSIELKALIQDSKIYLMAVAEVLAKKLFSCECEFAIQKASSQDKLYNPDYKLLKK
jgi:hypothetical protein